MCLFAAECAVMGVPSVTTNLSGYGSFLMENVEDSGQYGSYVIDRRFKGADESINDLTDTLLNFLSVPFYGKILCNCLVAGH